jgi:hypothetical protein
LHGVARPGVAWQLAQNCRRSRPGGLGKRFDLRALIKAAGLTPSMVRRAQFFASLTEAEFEALLARSR